jgi:hypothetical protein
MAGQPTFDWSLDNDDLHAAVVKAGGKEQYAAIVGCTRPTLDYQLKRRGIFDAVVADLARARAAAPGPGDIDAAGATLSDDEAAFYAVKYDELADADALLRRRGFDPDEWQVTGASITEWGRDPETGAPYQRLKVTLKRRVSLLSILPAAVKIPAVRPVKTRARHTRQSTWVIASDQHAPYHDQGLHACFLRFLRDTRPRYGVLAGDTLDFPTPSRHRRNPKFNASPQECVDAAYRMLRDYRQASPDTRWVKLLGNHDVRVRNFLLESAAPDLATLRPASTGELNENLSSALAVSRLLHLDALGIECVEPDGEYADEMATVCRHLGVIHGESTGKHPEDAILDRYGHSVAFGHVHRKVSAWHTTWDFDGPSTHTALGLGCMCEIKDGLGYVRRPNWQPGFGWASVWPDGRFNLEHASYVGGSLFFRDKRWDADEN